MADKLNRPWRFFLHYNKPMSNKCGVPVWTIHWRGKCYQAYNLKVRAWTETHEQNRQPRGIVRGYAWQLELVGPQPEGCNLYSHAWIHAPTSHGGELRAEDWNGFATVKDHCKKKGK